MNKLKSSILTVKNTLFPEPAPVLDYTPAPLRGYVCNGQSCSPIAPENNQEASVPLSETLMQPAGYVDIDGQVFDLTQNGIYRFFRLPSLSEQRLVCNGELESLLNMLGYLWLYGNKNGNDTEQLINTLTSQSVVISCGVQAELAQRLFSNYGIKSRLVAVMSHEPWNGQDDGHTLLEIYDTDAGWSVYDPSFRQYFKGHSIVDLCQAPSLLETAITLPGLPGYGGFENNNYNYALWVEEILLSQDAFLHWYQNKMGVPLIKVDNNYHSSSSFLKQSDADNFKKCYMMMEETAFYNEFYPNKKA